MSEKTLCAAFYLPIREEQDQLADLANLRRHAGTAGVRDIVEVSAADRQRLGLPPMLGTWEPVYQCGLTLERLADFLLFEIAFSQNRFLELLSPEDADTLLPDDPPAALAYAFRDACLSLQPDAAFLTTHLFPDLEGYLREQDYRVLSRDADLLASERFGLLYLSPDIAPRLSPRWRAGRDEIDVSPAYLGFAGTGDSRWF